MGVPLEHVDTFWDPVYLVGGAAALLTLRYILIVLFFEPIALRLMCLKGRVLSKEDRQGLNKFIKYQWHCLVYIVLLVWGWKIMFEMPWTPWNKGDIDSMWHGYPHHAASEKLPAKAFYMAQVSWYMHGFMESLIVDASRNDFVVMLVHHVLAVCLIAGAYCGNAHRVALAVVCEQDVSDILLYISKMIQKSAAVPLFQNKLFQAVTLWQLIFAWWATRCFTLGRMVFGAYAVVGPTGLMTPWGPKMDALSLYLIAQLALLWCMQMFWGLGLLKMGVTQLRRGVIHDFFHDKLKKDDRIKGSNSAKRE